MIHSNERTMDEIEIARRTLDAASIDLRVAAPGIIQSVDYGRQTCTVQLAIRERLNHEGDLEWVDIPTLPDVPFFVYSGGGYCLTLPVAPGDECLVVFGDSCMDAWWQNGGVQNQADHRRHDLSDGFAIVGFRSQPNIVRGFSSGSAMLRNNSGSAYIEIAGDAIHIQSGGTTIDGVPFMGHTHSGVESGGSSTGGVNG
nr:MAG TPA: baseplate component [Caudoviricetes sp.]